MLALRNLQKIIGQDTVLAIESFSVRPGEIAALVGPSGSGKEILFDLLVGKRTPSAGTIELAGTSPAERGLFSRRVGVLFPEDGLYKHLTPLENLRLHGQFYGLPAGRATEVLGLVGLADQGHTRLAKLAPGLQRRVAFGRAILHHPAVLLLCEPFARCDQATIGLLGGLIAHLAEGEAAVLILADSPVHLAGLCDSIHSLEQGRLVAVEPGGEAPAAPAPFKIPVRQEDKVILVNPAEIFYAEAEGGHTRLHTSEGCLPAQFTLGEIEERLARSGFFRAHRSYLVNLQHVKEVIPFTRNSFSIRLDDAERTLIPLSK
jgi:ABC-2 type transport system ATP-binding protein